ncbi:Myosin light chain kinase A [Diplonema papillatum]|nr:Myosin light chain kinase A [Diplonema papillatum]
MEGEKLTPSLEPSPVCRAQSIDGKYDLRTDEILGVGGFAVVVSGKVRATGARVAVKVIEREKLKGKRYAMMCHEREILRFARHPNIVRLHECVETAEHIYMVMERMDYDLYTHIKDRDTLSEAETARIINCVLKGVLYLHDNCIVHRDIKPENILLDSAGGVKLADFGIAKVLESWSVDATPIGTSYYMAPEVIRSIQLEGLKPRQTTREEVKYLDIWSTGVVAYIAMCGVPPFYGTIKTKEEREQLLRRIDRGVLFPASLWKDASDLAKDFVAAMLTVDVNDRLNARTALQHPFLSQSFAAEAGRAPSRAPVPGPKPSRVEVQQYLDSLLTACDQHLDPSDAAECTDDVQSPTTSASAQQPSLPKPENPMKLRRSRRPLPASVSS